MKEFQQACWNENLIADCKMLLDLAIQEDLGKWGDCTTTALVPANATGQAAVVARQSGVLAGLPAAILAASQINPHLMVDRYCIDGRVLAPGDQIAVLSGPAAGLLSAERLVLNLLGRLSGIATLTRTYVDAVAGTRARIYDTRKTTPGWRRLEKYAVRCGGGWNHRTGLFEAVLIKDNHLAFGAKTAEMSRFSPAEAVGRARAYLAENRPAAIAATTIVEIEVDTLAQLEEVLPANPDIVLLDNMSPAQLRQAVALRDSRNPAVELEASGGVNLNSVRQVAESGVERISVGALTHSAVGLDIGLDWIVN